MSHTAGHIIIESLRTLGELEAVRECSNKKRLAAALEKPDSDWTKPDLRFILKCVDKAIDNL